MNCHRELCRAECSSQDFREFYSIAKNRSARKLTDIEFSISRVKTFATGRGKIDWTNFPIIFRFTDDKENTNFRPGKKNFVIKIDFSICRRWSNWILLTIKLRFSSFPTSLCLYTFAFFILAKTNSGVKKDRHQVIILSWPRCLVMTFFTRSIWLKQWTYEKHF